MTTKKQALYLLEEGFDEDRVALVHGTSVESVLAMFSTNILPPSSNPSYLGYIYFTPVTKAFVGHPFYSEFKQEFDIGEAERVAHHEAVINQRSAYLNKLLGSDIFVKRDDADANPIINLNDDEFSREDLRKILEPHRKDLCSYSKLLKVYHELNNCQGVLLGVSKDFLAFVGENIEIDPEYDDGNAVRIYLPNGLDARHLLYMFPCGELEEKALQEFIKTLPEK